MLRELAERLVEYAPELRFRAFTDSAPVAEKSLAVRAGFGWIGRNSLVVNPKLGSMMLLGGLIINEVVDVYDSPMDGVGCGSCRACVDNCPNSAILDNRTIDARRCISCRTIEREGATDEIKLDGWIFGCDACQTVCPFNRHAPMHTNPRFDPIIAVDTLDEARWQSMSEEEFVALASETPLTRSGLERIRGNIGK
jgi:epoxyqueuosine reductase